jgi:beta-glucanase (GH16 family)
MLLKTLFPAILFTTLGCSKPSGGGGTVQSDPAISIDDVSAFEGNSGTSSFQFEVTLSHASSKTITVAYSTADGSAKQGQDYTAISNQTLTFQPNETSKTITVSVVADDIEEANDQFSVVLSNATNATIAKSTGVGTIKNDDTKAFFTNAGYDAPTSYPGYTLAWSDEFNGATLDPAVWTLETGTGSGGWGNNELEYYTDRPDNTSLQDGKLVIHALQESFGGAAYTSARIKTQGKKEFTFGRIDIRAILPKGKGVWPALWMLGGNINTVGWPGCGETDIMELLGQDPTKVYGTMHYGTLANHGQKGSSYVLTTGSFSDQFHVFSLEWKQDQVSFYIDNNLYQTITKTDIGPYVYPFNAPFFFIFNVAVGGNWPGSPDATTYLPQWMIVDYVRVYQ